MAHLQGYGKTLIILCLTTLGGLNAFPQDDLQMAVMNGIGIAKDMIDQGAAVKTSKTAEIDVGPAKMKTGHDIGVGFGDAMNSRNGNDDNEDTRKRRDIDKTFKMRVRREPCNQRLRITTTGATDIDARRKRDVNYPDVDNNVLPDEELANRTGQLSDSIKEVWKKMVDTITQFFDGVKQKIGTAQTMNSSDNYQP